MVELKGSLNGIGLPAIVQLIGELHHSGSLYLSKRSARGMLDFDDGRLVAAEFAEEHGFDALAKLSFAMVDGEFTFIEGSPTLERTLDLGQKEVQTYLRRIASGEDIAETVEPPPPEGSDPSLGPCPMLGFADDRARHYSRATALHRCFATGAPTLVTSQEQRELCLSGRYPTCPRYRNASLADSIGGAATLIAPLYELPRVTASRPEPTAAPTPTLETGPIPTHLMPPAVVPRPPERPVSGPPAGGPSKTVPANVAASSASASSMHTAEPSSDKVAPTWLANLPDEPDEPADSSVRPPVRAPASLARTRQLRWRRALLLVGTGVVTGLLLLVGIALVSLPSMNRSLVAQKPVVAGAQSFGVPTATIAPPVAAAASSPAPAIAGRPLPSAVPARAPAVAAPSPPPVAASAAAPVLTASAPAGVALLDARFATNGGEGWLNNPPFAEWTDGAFRLHATQATRFVAVGAPIDDVPSDVVVSATFRKTGGPPGGGYGLVMRDQGPLPRDGVNQTMNAYVLEAGDLGEFGVWRRDGDHWVDLVPWTRSSSVRPGGSPNELVVRASGDTLKFSINGTQVASVQDDTLLAGGVGVFMGGDLNEVALDGFVVQLPD